MKPLRPHFWWKENYVDVRPCMRWKEGERISLGEFARWYKHRRANEGLRCGRPFDRAAPRLRKSQKATLRRARLAANRWLRIAGLSHDLLRATMMRHVARHLLDAVAYKIATKIIRADWESPEPRLFGIDGVMIGTAAIWSAAGWGDLSYTMAAAWRGAMRDSVRDRVSAIFGSAE